MKNLDKRQQAFINLCIDYAFKELNNNHKKWKRFTVSLTHKKFMTTIYLEDKKTKTETIKL